MSAQQPGYPPGVKLGVDVGLARVGLASCDPGGVLATPVRTLRRDPRKNTDIALIAREARERSAVQVFVGLPATLKGEEGSSAQMARDYARLLAAELTRTETDAQVRLIDERLSTVSAHRHLHEAGISSRNHRKLVDQVAAVGILQQAIDSQRSLQGDVGVLVSAGGHDAPAGTDAEAARPPHQAEQPIGQEGDDQ